MWVALGLLLIPIGAVGMFLPTHLIGAFLVFGLILVLRNSMRWRRRFVRLQRRYPRYMLPIRHLLRGQVVAVLWHQALRTERILPRKWRRLRPWRMALTAYIRRLRRP